MGNIRWVTWFDVNEYPDSDGEPIAENTLQYAWITKIKNNLDILVMDDPDVFVAADLDEWLDQSPARCPLRAGRG